MKIHTNKTLILIGSRKRNGFTLMELLVSLGIIAALSMIMAPMVIGKVQESKEKADISNANSIAMAVKTEMMETNNGTVTVNSDLIENISEKYFDGKLPTPQSVEDADFDIKVTGYKVNISAAEKIFYPYEEPITESGS